MRFVNENQPNPKAIVSRLGTRRLHGLIRQCDTLVRYGHRLHRSGPLPGCQATHTRAICLSGHAGIVVPDACGRCRRVLMAASLAPTALRVCPVQVRLDVRIGSISHMKHRNLHQTCFVDSFLSRNGGTVPRFFT